MDSVIQTNTINLSQSKSSSGGLESKRVLAEMTKCGFTIVKGKTVPIKTSGIPAPVSPELAPASLTTSQIITATLQAAVSPTDPNTRFSSFFPPPIPPPQFLQPGFVKYNINNEPKYSAKPCVGFRRFDP